MLIPAVPYVLSATEGSMTGSGLPIPFAQDAARRSTVKRKTISK
jgi:hypothetical protein